MYTLAVDLGTSGAKVALVSTDDGTIAGHETEPTTLRLLPGGGAEQDPDDWWHAVVTASRRLLGGAGVPSDDIAAVCMSAQWGGTVAVDEAGRPVHRAVIWMRTFRGIHKRTRTLLCR